MIRKKHYLEYKNVRCTVNVSLTPIAKKKKKTKTNEWKIEIQKKKKKKRKSTTNMTWKLYPKSRNIFHENIQQILSDKFTAIFQTFIYDINIYIIYTYKQIYMHIYIYIYI